MKVVHEAVSPVGLCYVEVDVDDVAHCVLLIGHKWGTSCDRAYESSCVVPLLAD